MERDEMKGKVSTVLGFIKPEELGFTLAHEHLVMDFRPACLDLEYASDRHLAMQPISLENLDWIRKHRFSVLDNLLLLDEQEALEETVLFKNQGGKSIVELSNPNLGRDPLALARISRATGVHIIMGAGYYTSTRCHGEGFENIGIDDLVEEFTKEIKFGVGDTGIRPGVLGELGCVWPLATTERKVLQAAGRTQKITGIPINIHPGRDPRAPMEILEILSESGADLNHVMMSHIDRTLMTHESRVEVVKTGCCIIYDSIGREGYFDLDIIIDIPNDNFRVNDILRLADEGFSDRIMLSSDVCTKDMRVKYGGHGYVHIPKYFVPLMRKKGVPEEVISNLVVNNPAKFLSIF